MVILDLGRLVILLIEIELQTKYCLNDSEVQSNAKLIICFIGNAAVDCLRNVLSGQCLDFLDSLLSELAHGYYLHNK